MLLLLYCVAVSKQVFKNTAPGTVGSARYKTPSTDCAFEILRW